jgi:hypothetical protein
MPKDQVVIRRIYMAAFTEKELLEYLKDHPIEFSNCSFCNKQLFRDSDLSTGGVVLWRNPDMILHQACAEELSIHLIQDARLVIQKTGYRTKCIHEKVREYAPKT